MITIPGYEIQKQIHESLRTLVYRGINHQGCQPVILKVLKAEYPEIIDLIGMRNEYRITEDLDVPGVLQSYSLETFGNSLILILEDFGGQYLSDFLKTNLLSLEEFLKIAIALADILERLHAALIIHKDIKPSSIIIHPDTKVVKLTDFTIATKLQFEQNHFPKMTLLEGTLPYMSPEQTGRMNRILDYRSDFYSLGVTFYEVLAKRLPFPDTDPIELIYCHIAQQPLPLNQVADIPLALANLVMKLMAKNAEDRYVSAAGLKVDLEYCLSQLQSQGEIKPFILGKRDHALQLLIPQKLYGRETEVLTLIEAFGRISQGARELILISGYSGIGKTSIVNEVSRPIVAAQGYFIRGKFDQFKRDIPYAALIQGFTGFISHLLVQSEAQIAFWKDQLLNALGTNAQVIIEIIPEVEILLGSQPSVPKLGASATQNRFNRYFTKFVQVFSQPEHPLVIFLDDLQWADAASLKLLQILSSDNKSKYLLMIGAYRDNEVNLIHPLVQTLNSIQETATVVHQLKIQPLSNSHVYELVRDTLKAKADNKSIKTLSDLLYHKTQGNAFFLVQLLKTLSTEKIIAYQAETDCWEWNLEHIQAVSIIDYNVVELIAKNIQKLPLETQQILKLAACVGNYFSLEVLAIISQESEIVTAKKLWLALQTGLILPQSGNYKIPLFLDDQEVEEFKFKDIDFDYKFLHDRVQQAAYSLIPEDKKEVTHFEIGQLLLAKIAPEQQQKNICAFVCQLNVGRNLLQIQAEKDRLAELNLIAGQTAKVSAAYESASNYLDISCELLARESWQNKYQLTLQIYLENAEVKYLNTNFEEAEEFCLLGIKNARNNFDKVKFYEIRIKLNLARNKPESVLEDGQKAVELLGISLTNSSPQTINFKELAALPIMTDSSILLAMQILNLIFGPACFSESVITLPILYTMLDLSRQYGHSPPGIYAYAVYGNAVAAGLDISLGYQLAQFALKLLDKLDAKKVVAQIHLSVYINLIYKKKHIKKTLVPLEKAIQEALNVGDIEFACHAANFYCSHLLLVGKELTLVHEQQKNYLKFIKNYKQEHPLSLLAIETQFVANLVNHSQPHLNLTGEFLNESEAIEYLLSINNRIVLFSIYHYKSCLCYLFRDYPEAIKNSCNALDYSAFIQTEIIFTENNFFYSLALLAQYRQSNSQAEREENLRQVLKNQELMQLWAHHAPMNFQYRYDLIEAEKARVLNQIVMAMELYDQAIEGAKKYGFLHHKALGNELAGDFYLSLGREMIAGIYLEKAHYLYQRWGVTAKVKDLETRYSQFVSIWKRSNRINPKDISALNLITNSDTNILDMTTIIKASQVLAAEIILEKLLAKLMHIVIKNTGAQKGFLILKKENQLFIEAEANIGQDKVSTGQILLSETNRKLPISLIHSVIRNQKSLVLMDAREEESFMVDPYILSHQPQSILCTPLLHQGQLKGVIYLENNLTKGAFTNNHLEIVQILCAQAAISLEIARLYAQREQDVFTLEQKVAERTIALEKANRELQQLVIIDALTQISNRRHFDQYLEQEWKRLLRERQPLSLILCDIDSFKEYNDHYGHVQGDTCLQQVSQCLAKAMKRPMDLVARYGGEEFIAVLPQTNSVEAIVVAKRIQEELRKAKIAHVTSKVTDYVTLSMGVTTTIPTNNILPTDLVNQADNNLYKAKGRGRNQFFFHPFLMT